MSIQTKIAEVLPTLAGWCVLEKAMAIAEIFDRIKPDVGVEIGVFGGSSFIPQALCCQENKKGYCYGVDPYSLEECLLNEKDPGNIKWWTEQVNYEQIYQQALAAIKTHHLEPYCGIIRLPSRSAHFLFDTIDVLSIDGNHSKEASIEDVFNYLPKLRKGGILLFDDKSWGSTQSALSAALEGCKELYVVNDTAVLEKK